MVKADLYNSMDNSLVINLSFFDLSGAYNVYDATSYKTWLEYTSYLN